jgi:hypothetical protein
VKGGDADPGVGEQLVEVPVELGVARPFPGSVERDDRGLTRRRVARRQRDPAVLDRQLFQRSSFGSGREWTSMRVVVGRVSAT